MVIAQSRTLAIHGQVRQTELGASKLLVILKWFLEFISLGGTHDCTDRIMNSKCASSSCSSGTFRPAWRSTDGGPWWLTGLSNVNVPAKRKLLRNCFLRRVIFQDKNHNDGWSKADPDDIGFNDYNCKHYSGSKYICSTNAFGRPEALPSAAPAFPTSLHASGTSSEVCDRLYLSVHAISMHEVYEAQVPVFRRRMRRNYKKNDQICGQLSPMHENRFAVLQE